ncbi:MAG: hypothetical protein M3362_14090 [Acidobacteriota bacterium]|nr:hypothetical protein [Acidobacteriota bacterium]
MNTTNLFVELIVIGIGGASWFGLLLFSVFGYGWVPTEQPFSTIMAVPLLSFIYLCGVITDRMADGIFIPFDKAVCRRYYCKPKKGALREPEHFYDDRNLILNKSERFAALYEYGRSRQRIARGWTVNAILLAITLNIFIAVNLSGKSYASQIALGGTLLLLLLGASSAVSWFLLSKQQYQKVHFQAEFIRENLAQ